MEDLLNTILNLLEIVLKYINPIPAIIEISMEDITTISRTAILMVVAGAIYVVVTAITGQRRLALVFAIAMGMMSTIMMPPSIILTIVVMYCFVARGLDGFCSGYAIVTLFRRPALSALIFQGFDQPLSTFHEIYSWVMIFWGFFGIFRLLRERIPFFNASSAIPLGISLLATFGMFVFPETSLPGVLLLLTYPLGLIWGIFIAARA